MAQKGKEMTNEELKLLQALHSIIEVEVNFLDNRQYDRYNELVEKAEEENIIW